MRTQPKTLAAILAALMSLGLAACDGAAEDPADPLQDTGVGDPADDLPAGTADPTG
ncbi:MAG: hypothetical protein H0V93_03750 [Euzebyales bacterium]|jgi:hypothetical protein|nr:hypothetical protein [Euzebyales bacterium]